MIRLTEDDTGVVESIEAGPHILDSGDRTEFESGAVRDMREGKGRCDLLPMEVVAGLLSDPILYDIRDFQRTGETESLYTAIDRFSTHWMVEVVKDKLGSCTDEEREVIETATYAEMCLDVAKHFEEGAKKYGDNNWRRGIPVYVYIDSAVRHYLKYLATWEDEPHDRAFVWNLMCCIWTCINKPELNDYAAKKGVN